MAQKDTRKLNFAENFALSGVAAVTSKTCAAPIERVKLMVQNQDEMIKSGRLQTPYKGVVDCATRITKEEGILSFWRGNLANCLRYFPTQALNFAFKPLFKKYVGFNKEKYGYALFMAGNICSGGLAGTASLFFVYSLDFARTRLANDAKGAKKGGTRQFNGLADVYTKIYKADGIMGLYRGFGISCAGIFVYRGFYFGLYDSAQAIMPSGVKGNFFANFLLGWVVTTTAGLMSYPIDTVRRRMMMSSGEKVKYTSSIGCAIGILKQEGIGSFFKGAGANILRGVAGAGVLAGFDVLKSSYIYYTS